MFPPEERSAVAYVLQSEGGFSDSWWLLVVWLKCLDIDHNGNNVSTIFTEKKNCSKKREKLVS